MTRVYIHEEVAIAGANRARYQHHMTANWWPENGPARRQLCFGVFSVVGSTGAWPSVVNVWEYAGWDDLAHNFGHELVGVAHQDPELARWWEVAAEFRHGGFDRIAVAPAWSPGIEDHQGSGWQAAGYLHEWWRCPPGRSATLADALAELVEPYAAAGLRLALALRTAMGDDTECLALWGFDDWQVWAEFESERAQRAELVAWWRRHEALATGRRSSLLVDAELSPLRTGRQPRAKDRRRLDSDDEVDGGQR
ncbi:MAG: hypothetical protein R2754_13135 [Microthrixaceae bacterium]